MTLVDKTTAELADPVATNSNRRRNNRTHQDTSYPPTLFISETIPKGKPAPLVGNVLRANSQKLKHQ